MILVKTDKSRALLGERRALSPRARQLLVLADGKRSQSELSALLGFQVDGLAQQLMGEGLLARHDGPARALAAAKPPAPAPLAATEAVASSSAASASGPAPLTINAPRAEDLRRSFAGSKMYMVGLMQMLRDADATAHAVALHAAQDAAGLRQRLVGALAYLYHRSGPDYAARVAERLLEVFPLDELPLLCEDIVRTGLPAISVPALVQGAMPPTPQPEPLAA